MDNLHRCQRTNWDGMPINAYECYVMAVIADHRLSGFKTCRQVSVKEKNVIQQSYYLTENDTSSDSLLSPD